MHKSQIKVAIFLTILLSATAFATQNKSSDKTSIHKPAVVKKDDPKVCTFEDPSFATRKFVKLKIEGEKPPVQHVLSAPKECPAKGACLWQMKEVVPPSMKMLAGKSFEGFTCVKRKLPFNNVKIVGWVPTKNLNFLK